MTAEREMVTVPREVLGVLLNEAEALAIAVIEFNEGKREKPLGTPLFSRILQFRSSLSHSDAGSQESIGTKRATDATSASSLSVRAFVAWHPVAGFGPVNEIALREHVDHAQTDANLLNHTGGGWEVVPVDIQKGHWF